MANQQNQGSNQGQNADQNQDRKSEQNPIKLTKAIRTASRAVYQSEPAEPAGSGRAAGQSEPPGFLILITDLTTVVEGFSGLPSFLCLCAINSASLSPVYGHGGVWHFQDTCLP